MSDEIVGVAVLARPESGWPGKLFFLGKRADGSQFITDICIMPEGSKKPDFPVPIWWYKEEGDTLHCHPSVNAVSLNFHNGYSWSVKFVEYDDSPSSAGDKVIAANCLEPRSVPAYC